MFNIFKRKKKTAIWETDFDDIWNIDNRNDMIIALGSWLSRKCNYGEDIDKLSPTEQIVFFIFQLEAEVNNGGFTQYFGNFTGIYANETLTALRKIGAIETANICKNVFSYFGETIPTDRDEYDEFIGKTLTDEVEALLHQYDMEFFKFPDNLTELTYKFAIDNKAQFSR